MKRSLIITIILVLVGAALLGLFSGETVVTRILGKAALGATLGGLIGLVSGLVRLARSGWRPSQMGRTSRALVSTWLLWPFAASSWKVIDGFDWDYLMTDNPALLFLPPLLASGIVAAVRWVRSAPSELATRQEGHKPRPIRSP